jgi:hypothetical protein
LIWPIAHHIPKAVYQKGQNLYPTRGTSMLTTDVGPKERRQRSKSQNKGQQMNGNHKRDNGKGNHNKKCRYAPCGMIGHTKDDCIKKPKATLKKLGHLKDDKASSSSIVDNTAAMSNTSSNDYDNTIQLFIAKQGNEN